MKKTSVLILLVLLFSCKSEEEKKVAQITGAIETSIKDAAFKANEAVVLLEVRYLDRREITENEMDSIRLIERAADRKNLRDIAELEIKYANLLIAETSAKSKMAALSGKQLNAGSVSNAKAEIKVHTDRAKSYLDSIPLMIAEDSELRDKMNNRKQGGEKFYLVRYVQKSTIGGHNTLDTLQAMFTNDLKLKQAGLM